MKELCLKFKLIVICEFLYLLVAGEKVKIALTLPFARSLLTCDLQVGQLHLQIHDQVSIFLKFLIKPSPVVPGLLVCVLESLIDELLAVV